MRKITVNTPGGAYQILLKNGLLGNIVEYLEPFGRAAVVSDSNVYPVYGKYFAGLPAFIIQAGEESKNHAVLLQIYDFLSDHKLSRQDVLVALGGGVVGDLSGYAAATFKRGMRLAQVPTTLLAQVDSSVGGKVGVNLPAGKNMAGAFYQPCIVLTDTEFLKTLNKRQFSSGMAEVIKYALIADERLYTLLREKSGDMEEIIHICCSIKARYVQEDPFDRGVRMQLNFGHTMGHAIETVTGYGRYLHGEAVAIGMVLAARAGERLGVSAKGLEMALRGLNEQYNLPSDTEDTVLKEAQKILMQDKKAQGGRLPFVLVDRIGHAVVSDFKTEELGEILHD